MKTDLSCYVIRRNRRYLVAVPEMMGAKPKYSPHAYDAAQIKSANDARRIADKVGGNVHRFNPLTGEVV